MAAAQRMIADSARIGSRLRETLAEAKKRADPVSTAAAWVDEDVSRLLETLMANLVLGLREAGAPAGVIEAAEQTAVGEARYRESAGLDGVGRVGMDELELEHLEFRRHVLKRFTSSVLWLSPEIRPAATWVLHMLYAVAASVAMGFAILATLWQGQQMTAQLGWVVAAVAAYAVKDRMKAMLQSTFSQVVARHFPDRRWQIRDRQRGVEIGEMDEQSGFMRFAELPADVLAVRRATRKHALEEEARPETVIFHKKEVELSRARVEESDPRFDALTEILRLDLRRWLHHTDDPKRDFTFADPTTGAIGHATAPRVYNIAIVFRLSREDDTPGPWHRVRVVVTRKGIRRIDHLA